jgi:hypothetical protein
VKIAWFGRHRHVRGTISSCCFLFSPSLHLFTTLSPILPRLHATHNEDFVYTMARYLIHDILDQVKSPESRLTAPAITYHTESSQDGLSLVSNLTIIANFVFKASKWPLPPFPRLQHPSSTSIFDVRLQHPSPTLILNLLLFYDPSTSMRIFQSSYQYQASTPA